jgi:hypothetical protein
MADPFGGFTEEALAEYQKALAERERTDFAEGDSYDFTRCVRPNGTSYGTGGKCRKGTEEAKELKNGGDLTKVKKLIKEKTAKKAEAAPEPVADKAKKVEAVKAAQAEYTKVLKKQMELVAKGDMAGAEKMGAKVKAGIAKIKEAEEAKKTPEEKTAERKYADERAEMEKKQKLRDAEQDKANLTAVEKKAIKDYTQEYDPTPGRSYSDVNKCLRDPSICESKGESMKFAKELDSAIKTLPSNDAGDPFYRGIPVREGAAAQLYSSLENAKPGTRLKDPGYGSYSAGRREAENFLNDLTPDSKNIMFVSRNKTITPVNRFSEFTGENEAILPRGTSQTIRSVRKEGGTLIVELD